MGRRKDSYKSRKKSFRGNQHSGPVSTSKTPENPQNTGKRKSSSASKLGSKKRLRLENETNLEGNRIMDIGLLSQFIGSVSCPDCHEKTLSMVENTDGKRKFFTINRLLPIAIMSTGNHYTAARRLTTGLNLPPPQTLSSWQKHLTEIKKATETIATVSMKRAAKEVRCGDEITDVIVSCDGTWQRRGFSSKNGVGTILTVAGPGGSSKVVDTCTLSNYCVKCSTESSIIYMQWNGKNFVTLF